MVNNNVQVLITTMDLDSPERLLETMNINSSFIIGNQSNKDDIRKFIWNNNEGLIITRNEKGVGANRNITLKFSSASYCILADDDMCFYDDYPSIVIKAFEKNPTADVLIFNLHEKNPVRRINKRKKRVGLFNYMNYGAARIVFRRSSVSYNGISFNYNFGGGTNHSAGEDSLFLRDCLLHGLKIVAIPETLASLSDTRESTWFNGYTDKYIFDKGVFLGVAHPKLAYLFALYFSLKHKEYSIETKSIKRTFNVMAKGINYVKRRFV
ncbi:MAG: glycosyltransferase [Spirochaetaceae bacterium]|nr:glycosyltransferase [Spirochaetaceae bacterium]